MIQLYAAEAVQCIRSSVWSRVMHYVTNLHTWLPAVVWRGRSVSFAPRREGNTVIYRLHILPDIVTNAITLRQSVHC